MIDTRPARLAALRAQAERLAPWERGAVMDAFDVADNYLEGLDRISRERYRPEREAEDIAAARTTAVGGFGRVLAAVDAAVAAERTRVVDDYDGVRLTRAREGRRLADVIDVSELLATDDAGVVRGLVETADEFGLGAEARVLALRAVKPKAAAERYRVGGKWFGLLCWLSEATRPNNRHDVSGRVDIRRDVLRTMVRQVAEIVGVGAGLARESAKPAPMPDDVDVKPTMVVGRFWDLNPSYRR